LLTFIDNDTPLSAPCADYRYLGGHNDEAGEAPTNHAEIRQRYRGAA